MKIFQILRNIFVNINFVVGLIVNSDPYFFWGIDSFKYFAIMTSSECFVPKIIFLKFEFEIKVELCGKKVDSWTLQGKIYLVGTLVYFEVLTSKHWGFSVLK